MTPTVKMFPERAPMNFGALASVVLGYKSLRLALPKSA
jgi:hypothetical protein